MNLFDGLRVLSRRWYLTLPGVILAAALAAGAWITVSPSYARTASVLLLPNEASLPDNGNPYLYVSGLSQAADVLVRAVNSQQNLDQINDQYPGAKVTVARDPSTVTPVVTISVETGDSGQAGALLDDVLDRTSTALATLQDQEAIPKESRISMQTLTSDAKSTASNKQRMALAGGAGIGGLVLVFILIAGVEGILAARSRRRLPKPVASERPVKAEAKDGAAA